MTRAARLVEYGKPLEIHDVDLPEPGLDEVVVELLFAGVNPIDRNAAEGRAPTQGPVPRTLGGEGSGRLEGKPVLVFSSVLGAERDGTWAEAVVAPREYVFDVPEGVDMQEVAAMGIAGLTAWNVVNLAEVGDGDRVLVFGAAGGVGLPVVGLAASTGATVWGQTSSEDKAEAVRAGGAERVVVTDGASLADSIRDFRPTVVIDPLGNGFTAAALLAMEPRGRLVLFGTSAGAEATLQLRELYRKSLSVFGYGGLRLTNEERRKGLEAALEALASGRLRIPIGRVWPLDGVNGALESLADRTVTGKAILQVR
jgi:NADPH2:quinone reductase